MAGNAGAGGEGGSTLAAAHDQKNQPFSSASPIWRLIAAFCLASPLFLLVIIGAGLTSVGGGCCC